MCDSSWEGKQSVELGAARRLSPFALCHLHHHTYYCTVLGLAPRPSPPPPPQHCTVPPRPPPCPPPTQVRLFVLHCASKFTGLLVSCTCLQWTCECLWVGCSALSVSFNPVSFCVLVAAMYLLWVSILRLCVCVLVAVHLLWVSILRWILSFTPTTLSHPLSFALSTPTCSQRNTIHT